MSRYLPARVGFLIWLRAAASLTFKVKSSKTLKVSPSAEKLTRFSCTACGFTFIEVITVVAILGIISAIIMTVINPGRRVASARDTDRITGVKQIKTAIDSYQALHNYPPSCDGNDPCPTGEIEITGSDFLSAILKDGDFLKTVPQPPSHPAVNACRYHAYLYPKAQNKYWLSFCLEGWSKSQVESLPDNDGVGGGSPDGSGRYWCYFTDADGVAVCWVGMEYEIPPL